MAEFLRACPPELYQKPGQYHRTKHTITLVNGTRYYFMELKNPDSLLSANLGAVLIDEAVEVPRLTFANAVGCLRITAEHRIRNMVLVGIPREEASQQVMASEPIRYYCLLGSNPGPGWVKELFVDNATPILDGSVFSTGPGFVYIPSYISDNLENLPTGYEDELAKTYSDVERQRYLKGDWSIFEGKVFSGFHRDTHVVRAFEPPSYWKLYLGIDHGEAAPASIHLWGHDGENFIVCDEHYVSGKSVEHHVREAYRRWGHLPVREALIDPSVVKQRSQIQGRVWTIKEEYEYWLEQLGWNLHLRLGNNAIPAGITAIQRLMTLRPDHLHIVSGKSPAPQFYIMDNCPKAIAEVENTAYKTDPDKHSDPELPARGPNHFIDEARYVVNHLFTYRELPRAGHVRVHWLASEPAGVFVPWGAKERVEIMTNGRKQYIYIEKAQ